MDGATFNGMSTFLRRLLPTSPWVIAAISGDAKEVRTFRADLGASERERAFDWIAARPWCHFRVLAGRAVDKTLSRVPNLEHVAEVHAVGVRASPSQAKALRSLAKPPAITFRYFDRFIAVWRFNKPVPPDKADEAEQLLAERFGDHRLRVEERRLNFFIQVPRDADVEDFTAATIDPKDIASLSHAEEEDAEDLSADCAPEQRKFAIEPIAQRGAITLVSGEAGMGKSQIALHLAMCVTRGVGLPGQPTPPICGVLVDEQEDGWKEDVIPRLIANGADRRLIKGIHASDLNTERGVGRLDAARVRFEDETGIPVGMAILSPYMACFGTGANQETHMREALRYISAWAKKTNIAVLGVAHLADSTGKSRVVGPGTHRRLARGSWKVIINENDPEPNEKRKQRLLVADKVNNTPDDFSLAYRIQGVSISGGIKTSKIVWETPIDSDGSRFLNEGNDAPKGKREAAARWIQEQIRGGLKDQAELRKKALQEGITNGTFIRALDDVKRDGDFRSRIPS